LKILVAESENPNLWDNPQVANKILKEKKTIELKINKFDKCEILFNENLELSELADLELDLELENEVEKSFKKLQKDLESFKIECFFSNPLDHNNCFLDINAGAGGTESHDWASILLRMYLRFAEKMGFKAEIVNMIEGEEAGIKSCTIKVQGENAYGWLRTESGVHRLVRISPFNAAGKRMTSFSSAWAYPEIDESMDIVIEEKDMKIDTYRASGAGGQHVNTTDSAVRITHIPTGIVTQCQSGRSQHKNKAEAISMLKARLYEKKIREKQEEIDKQNSTKTENGWGHQIRSYVLQPYQMVKDARTSYETSDAAGVLDGDLEKFISASLSGKEKEN
jgi:peptide chain release factor 2